MNKSLKMEAKGVFIRNNLKISDFAFKGSTNIDDERYIANDIMSMRYDKNYDFKAEKDAF